MNKVISIFSLSTFAPVVAEAFGLQDSMSTGVISPLTYKIIPSIVKTVGYGLMGSEGALAINEISGIGNGQNWMLDNVFGGDQSKYDIAAMIVNGVSMGFMQVGTDNAGLKTEKVKDDNGGVNSEVPKVSYDRPSGYRKGVREKVWENIKNADGEVIDPVTGKVMDPS